MNFSSGTGEKPSVHDVDSAIRTFENLGESGPHAPDGWLLCSILNHCVAADIPFTLVFVPKGGFYVKRGVTEGVMPERVQATLERK